MIIGTMYIAAIPPSINIVFNSSSLRGIKEIKTANYTLILYSFKKPRQTKNINELDLR